MEKTENIIIRMRGGLGNQLFQLAYGMYLKREYNAKKIILDINEFKNYHVRNFELGKFNFGTIEIRENISSYRYNFSRNIYYVLQGITRRLSSNELDLFSLLTRLGLFYAGITPGRNLYFNNLKNIYVYGYFQNVTYVDAVREEMCKFVNIKDALRLKYKNNKILGDEYIAISIRCGQDYQKAGYHICNNDYYKRALDYIILKRAHKRIHVRVFADDIIKAREIIQQNQHNFEYVETTSPVQQLIIMMDCDHFVISNSSFSWWGAYLSKNNNKIVVSPRQWYPSPLIDTKDTHLIYENMVIL